MEKYVIRFLRKNATEPEEISYSDPWVYEHDLSEMQAGIPFDYEWVEGNEEYADADANTEDYEVDAEDDAEVDLDELGDKIVTDFSKPCYTVIIFKDDGNPDEDFEEYKFDTEPEAKEKFDDLVAMGNAAEMFQYIIKELSLDEKGNEKVIWAWNVSDEGKVISGEEYEKLTKKDESLNESANVDWFIGDYVGNGEIVTAKANSIRNLIEKIKERASNFSEIDYDDVRVDGEELMNEVNIGKEFQDFIEHRAEYDYEYDFDNTIHVSWMLNGEAKDTDEIFVHLDYSDTKDESLNEDINNYAEEAWLMNKVIAYMNNEDAYYGGWLYTWPDGETKEDCANDFGDKESFEDLKKSFIRYYKMYHEDGLYNADRETVDYAHKQDKALGLEPIEVLGDIKESDEDINSYAKNKLSKISANDSRGNRRSDLTNIEVLDEIPYHDFDDGKDHVMSIVKYIPQGALDDGRDSVLYACVTDYDGSKVWTGGAIVAVDEEMAREEARDQIELREMGSKAFREKYLSVND